MTTRLPHVFVARYLGDSAAAARTYFATLWRVLRPALAGREAVEPRIWRT
jgi:urease accessory protein